MTITVTNTNATLLNLLNANQRLQAENNRGGSLRYYVTIYNPSVSAGQIIYTELGAGATVNSLPLFPGTSAAAGDSRQYTTGDLSKINLLASVASIPNVIIEIEPAAIT